MKRLGALATAILIAAAPAARAARAGAVARTRHQGGGWCRSPCGAFPVSSVAWKAIAPFLELTARNARMPGPTKTP